MPRVEVCIFVDNEEHNDVEFLYETFEQDSVADKLSVIIEDALLAAEETWPDSTTYDVGYIKEFHSVH